MQKLSLLSALLLATSVHAGTIAISFEAFPGPDGVLGTNDDIPAPNCGGGVISICGPIGNDFSTMGIQFSSGTLFQGSFFAGTTSSNHFISSSPPDATFSFQVYGISILSYSLWSDVLYALDSSNSVIATNTLTNPNSGSSFFLGTLNLSSAQPMSRFTVLPSGCSIGGTEGSCDEILNLDNLVLTTVPEPSLLLPILAALALAVIRHKNDTAHLGRLERQKNIGRRPTIESTRHKARKDWICLNSLWLSSPREPR